MRFLLPNEPVCGYRLLDRKRPTNTVTRHGRRLLLRLLRALWLGRATGPSGVSCNGSHRAREAEMIWRRGRAGLHGDSRLARGPGVSAGQELLSSIRVVSSGFLAAHRAHFSHALASPGVPERHGPEVTWTGAARAQCRRRPPGDSPTHAGWGSRPRQSLRLKAETPSLSPTAVTGGLPIRDPRPRDVL